MVETLAQKADAIKGTHHLVKIISNTGIQGRCQVVIILDQNRGDSTSYPAMNGHLKGHEGDTPP